MLATIQIWKATLLHNYQAMTKWISFGELQTFYEFKGNISWHGHVT